MNKKILITLTAVTASILLETKTAAAQNKQEISLPKLENQKPRSTVYSYQWQGKRASTVYFRNIPILTFLEQNSATEAQKLAERLNQLTAEDANKINVIWNERDRTYNINLGDRTLATVNKTTILPDTTKNTAKDALQATNRLRRILGNAVPLKNIIGQKQTITPQIARSRQISGKASWYGPGFHGRTTANGERYNSNALTAAHPSLPFNTRVKVTNLNNGRSVVVRINDRGPYAGGRIIDLSAAAARRIGMIQSGVAPVKIEILGR